jgi:hypothetical protein
LQSNEVGKYEYSNKHAPGQIQPANLNPPFFYRIAQKKPGGKIRYAKICYYNKEQIDVSKPPHQERKEGQHDENNEYYTRKPECISFVLSLGDAFR